MVRPLGPTSVIPAVTAFLNRLLFEIEEEKLQKGLRFFCFFLTTTKLFPAVGFLRETNSNLSDPSSWALRRQPGSELPPHAGQLC